jgi:hypothetical protein
MAADQRYCLECGERRTPTSSVLAGGAPSAPPRATPPSAPPSPGVNQPPADPGWQRSSTLTVIAGVGVLLLAMGVGILIGRSGDSKSAGAPQQVVVSTTPGSGSGTTATAAEPTFSDSWPAGTSGYTVQLQTLPVSGTTVAAVEAAKAAASAKGAAGVGALKSEDFSSLAAGRYIVYSGVFHKKSEAQKALSRLKKSFPAATVISVSNRSSGAGGAAGGSSGGGGGTGSSLSKPAPPTVLQNLSKKKGKSYEQESKNLPNVISTG